MTAFAATCAFLFAAPTLFDLHGDIQGVHDPAITQANHSWYVFSTGLAHPGHIPIRCSTDLHTWSLCGHVFDQFPAWATREIPGAHTAWAPDISRYRSTYRLYYAISTFGHNDSAIGFATSSRPDSGWVDKGMVLRSFAGRDDWNAIDPNLATDAAGQQWLVFGSFWGGIKMRRIDNESGLLSSQDTRLYSLAARPHEPRQPDAIEAPFLVRHDSLYYLFVSFDFCCRGAHSTYNIAVGRASAITGPYTDASGRPMLQGGGTVLVAGSPLWRGPGHEAVLLGGPEDILVFHAYDGTTGKPFLKISSIAWDHGWPRVAPLPGT